MQGRIDEADEIERRLKSVQEALAEELEAWLTDLKLYLRYV
jgi:hypothetical protein